MPKWLLDQHGGVLSTFEGHEDGFVIHQSQDVTSALDINRKLQNEGRHRFRDGSMELAARIPLGIVQKWISEDGINWLSLSKVEKSKYLRRKLNDPDYRYLRTGGGVF